MSNVQNEIGYEVPILKRPQTLCVFKMVSKVRVFYGFCMFHDFVDGFFLFFLDGFESPRLSHNGGRCSIFAYFCPMSSPRKPNGQWHHKIRQIHNFGLIKDGFNLGVSWLSCGFFTRTEDDDLEVCRDSNTSVFVRFEFFEGQARCLESGCYSTFHTVLSWVQTGGHGHHVSSHIHCCS